MTRAKPETAWEHNLAREVYSVLPIIEAVPAEDVAWRVYDRYGYAADPVRDILPSELEGPVADRLRRLAAKGRAVRIGDGWKRSEGR